MYFLYDEVKSQLFPICFVLRDRDRVEALFSCPLVLLYLLHSHSIAVVILKTAVLRSSIYSVTTYASVFMLLPT